MKLLIILLSFLFVSCDSVSRSTAYHQDSNNTNGKSTSNNSQNDNNSSRDKTEAKTLDYFTKYINEECDQLIDKTYFQICYNYSLNEATAVGYKLYGDLVDELNIKERPNFYDEPALPVDEKVKSNNYTNSGYDRGHMAPDAAFDWSQDSLEATYSMANIVPQVPEINREEWAKAEEHSRKMAKNLDEVTVVNVVIFDKNFQKVGPASVAVPKGFYKILYNSSKDYKECFYYENSKDNRKSSLNDHIVSCDKL